ncbi:ribosome maturation factor RimP [Leptothrix discophora]|uniref:Ribosome maturation factor RimP n=1 Tax=Leptothrix discophora TaxID=89 RepID=A0ABT9G2L2_LEPDI|nr:ribosome maturation factor RimP [Leptothrix discophora]MDP4300727.1 ribosome maturation factor RimP [Leptothrix discophora]
MNWLQAVEKTVTGLGYELVDCERGARGLLQVSIDRVPGTVYPTGPSEFVLVEDCEFVTRQLLNVLEVENVDYARLEVASPGLDRPLRKPVDYARFEGQEVEITLKAPFQGRKNYKGVLRLVASTPEAAMDAATAEAASAPAPVADATTSYELIFKVGKEDTVLGFVLDEVREARLVPVVDFKGRKRRTEAAPEGAAEQTGGHEE